MVLGENYNTNGHIRDGREEFRKKSIDLSVKVYGSGSLNVFFQPLAFQLVIWMMMALTNHIIIPGIRYSSGLAGIRSGDCAGVYWCIACAHARKYWSIYLFCSTCFDPFRNWNVNRAGFRSSIIWNRNNTSLIYCRSNAAFFKEKGTPNCIKYL